MRRTLCLLAVLLSTTPSWAVTARNLGTRISMDGYTNDFTEDERVFGWNEVYGGPEEASDDSKWGNSNDLNQIRITWDARNLYLAGEGVTWDNNMILFVDSAPEYGLGSMDSLNSWRRNFAFDSSGHFDPNNPENALPRHQRGFNPLAGFAPDLFVATWDTNLLPRLVIQDRGQSVRDLQVADGYFSAAASFDKGNTGRAMEVTIPWSTVFLSPVGRGQARDSLMTVGGVTDTVTLIPRGARLKICGVITAGGDGTGGPDVAPDNTRGCTATAGDAVYVDNYAVVELDKVDDSGLGARYGDGSPGDGVADWGVEPASRVSFRIRPPIPASVSRSLRFAIKEITLDRPAFRPDYGETIHFAIRMDPPPDSSNVFHYVSSVSLTANVYDINGRWIQNLFLGQSHKVLALPGTPQGLYDTERDFYAQCSWDGRDSEGRLVTPGVYVLRTVLEKDLSRATRAFVVVR